MHCDRELKSALDYNMRRHVELYVHDCNKKIVEEKYNNELKVVDAKLNNSIEPNPVNFEM